MVPSTETASSPTMRQAGGYEHQGDHLGVLMCALTAAPFASSGMGRSMAQATEQAGADRPISADSSARLLPNDAQQSAATA